MRENRMRASVKIRLGNMFDGPSDLIVLPCNTHGGVTQFVADHLRYFSIPVPSTNFEFGDVEVIPFKGGESISQYVAYAASVMYRDSTLPTAIEKIGKQLGLATKKHSSIRSIAAPLLGAGAGGLASEKSVMSLRKGFIENAVPDATLTISILHKSVFERVKEELIELLENDKLHGGDITDSSSKAVSQSSPRVFVSYAGTNPENKKWVELLATYLRENGVNARLDIWHLQHGMDLPQWMCNELQIADRVIIVSDEAYAQKANGRHGGVGWETMVIQGDLANLPPDSAKYVAIVRTEQFEDGIPFYLKTKFSFHWPSSISNDTQLRYDLLKELFKIPKEPPLGEPPLFV
ncbi:MAG: toll/interleukin-1 receptor domain-containing protein [Anaerolineales bacterium]